jgi:hypothetical protein
MAAFAQLEIIGPDGNVEFYSLDRPQGVTNIGRHPDNDIVIDSPNIASFHAIVDYQQWPQRAPQIILLSEEGQTTLEGQPLSANVPTALENWNTIKVDGYDIILLEGTAAGAPARATAPGPVPPMTVIAPPVETVPAQPPAGPPPLAPEPTAPPPVTPTPSLPMVPVEVAAIGPEQSDDYVVTELSEDAWEVDVEQTAKCQLTIINGGDRVASFYVSVEGVDAGWVYIDSRQVNLYEGDRATVSITITPPRAPTSLAGQHPIAIVVTSPTYPGRFSRKVATLTINPYYDFAVGEMSPKALALSWSRPEGAVVVPIRNNGNNTSPFVLDAADDERKCSFEFEVPGEEATLAMRAGLNLPPGGSHSVPVIITPPRRLISLRKQTYSFTITTSLLQGDQTPRSLMGRATIRPLFGFVHIALFAIAVVSLITFLFMPNQSPGLQASIYSTEAYKEEITLGFNTYRFPNRKPKNVFNMLNAAALNSTLAYKPDDAVEWEILSEPDDPSGAIRHKPHANGKYRVRADTWISRLLPLLRGETERQITVPPIPPRILSFTASPQTIDIGETVTVTWVISDADTVMLDLGSGEESRDDLEGGQERIALDQSTTFVLKAKNIFEEVTQVETVNVRPTPTPPPPPAINAFTAKPTELVYGDAERNQTALSWDVTTYMPDTKIEISILGSNPIAIGLDPKGTITVPVADTTVFMLSASYEEQVSTLQTMVSFLEPTPTPEPPPPTIELFQGTPNEVVAGDSQVVNLIWKVKDATSVDITGPNLMLSGLQPNDDIDVTVNETALFVLTAYNGDATASQPLEIKAIDPTPTPTPTPTPVPPPVIRFFTAQGPVDAVTQQSVSADGLTTVYNVLAATSVQLSWLVDNADEITLFGPGITEGVGNQGTRDIGQVISNGTYQLNASNDGGSATATVIIQVQLVPPPPPYDVTGVRGTDMVTITWRYDSSSFQKPYFIGFKIYSADVSADSTDTDFYEVGDWRKAAPDDPPLVKYTFIHDLAGSDTCGRAYYVTAIYQDVLTSIEEETDASTNSWYSIPCP